jgi:hypothetical protein
LPHFKRFEEKGQNKGKNFSLTGTIILDRSWIITFNEKGGHMAKEKVVIYGKAG